MKMTKLNKADREWAKGMVRDFEYGYGRFTHRWPFDVIRKLWVQRKLDDGEIRRYRQMKDELMDW